MLKYSKTKPRNVLLEKAKSHFLRLVRNPTLNLGINVGMLLMNGGACLTQFLEGNHVLAHILLISTLSCISAVGYWVFVVWDKKHETKKEE